MMTSILKNILNYYNFVIKFLTIQTIVGIVRKIEKLLKTIFNLIPCYIANLFYFF